MLKNIFLDLDDTILNFTAGEAKALSQTLREAGIDEILADKQAQLDAWLIRQGLKSAM